MSRPAFGMVVAGLLILAGCKATTDRQTARQSALPPLEPTVLQYVDTDGFDAVFEASLVNQDPVIVIRTASEKPDWQGRLNAWVAAWNMGGAAERGVRRGQIPLLGQPIDADLLREFRLLVFGGLDRAEGLAKAGSAWWHEERIRSRRVALLRPYSLRFHMGEDHHIHLIFFHGDHASRYPEFVKSIDGAEARDWARTVECSICNKMKQVSNARPMPKASE